MSDKFRSPYPGYDVLDKWNSPSWNEQTREVVRQRLQEVPLRQFFTEEEWTTLEAVCDRLIPQPDRFDNPVPIVPFIDKNLRGNPEKGYRFEDMPPVGEVWRLGLKGIEQESYARHTDGFRNLAPEQQDTLLKDLQNGEVTTGIWKSLPAKRFFTAVLKMVVGIYYVHPAAWNEMGYGGPASPRGYVRLGSNQRDPWEAKEEQRDD